MSQFSLIIFSVTIEPVYEINTVNLFRLLVMLKGKFHHSLDRFFVL